jgi:hypothetical protein
VSNIVVTKPAPNAPQRPSMAARTSAWNFFPGNAGRHRPITGIQ